jgi:hypothetical protein
MSKRSMTSKLSASPVWNCVCLTLAVAAICFMPVPVFPVDGLSYDLKKLMAFKDKTVKGLTGGIEHLFKKNSVTYVKGKGALKASLLVS